MPDLPLDLDQIEACLNQHHHSVDHLHMTATRLLAEVVKTRAELVTMTAVAKSNKRVTENYAQELQKALKLLAEYVDGEYPHRRAKQLLADNPAPGGPGRGETDEQAGGAA